MNYSMVYAQDLVKSNKDTISPKIDLIVVDGDTLFTINRKVAEQIAIEHDSLEIVSSKLKECNDVLIYSLDIKDQYKIALEKSEGVTDMLKKELSSKDKIINSYKKIDESQQALYNDLNKEFKKAKNRNKWLTGITIGGTTLGFTSLILLLLK